ncbi:MAG: helix-turn-helix domain-containing protein [Planctomycetota bacterium]|jgi:excisionase family DNA binding protein
MSKGKNVLTTGEVAKICNVAPRTVSKWFDKGQLKGYRIPGSKDRRIPLNELVRFMKMHNMPITGLPIGKIRVLIVDGSNGSATNFAEALDSKGDYEIQSVSNNFETGLVAQKFVPHVMLINLLSENISANQICNSIRSDEDLQTIKIIAIANQLSDSEVTALLQKGFDAYVTDPTDIDEIQKCIEQATAIVY